MFFFETSEIDLVWNPSKRSQLTGMSNLCGNQPGFVFQQMMLGHWSLMLLLACGLAFLSFLQKHPWFWQPEDCQLCTADCSNKTTLLSFLSSIKILQVEKVNSPPNNQRYQGYQHPPPFGWFWPTLKILKKLNSWKRGDQTLVMNVSASRKTDSATTKKTSIVQQVGGEVVWTLYPGVPSDTIFIAWSFWRQRLGIPEHLLKPFFEDSEI